MAFSDFLTVLWSTFNFFLTSQLRKTHLQSFSSFYECINGHCIQNHHDRNRKDQIKAQTGRDLVAVLIRKIASVNLVRHRLVQDLEGLCLFNFFAIGFCTV